MKIEVQLFAAARDAAGQPTVVLDLPAKATVADLRTTLVAQIPALQQLQHVLLVAVNSEYADDRQPVHENDKVACFPPVSGG